MPPERSKNISKKADKRLMEYLSFVHYFWVLGPSRTIRGEGKAIRDKNVVGTEMLSILSAHRNVIPPSVLLSVDTLKKVWAKNPNFIDTTSWTRAQEDLRVVQSELQRFCKGEAKAWELISFTPFEKYKDLFLQINPDHGLTAGRLDCYSKKVLIKDTMQRWGRTLLFIEEGETICMADSPLKLPFLTFNMLPRDHLDPGKTDHATVDFYTYTQKLNLMGRTL
jgi:hypothetical protein